MCILFVYVVPAHQTSDMSRSTISPESRSKLEMVVLSSRVRNSANPCVRDMSKSLRTCQMSVHGYPVDMSIFCNLQLGLLELQEETPQADINQDNVSLAGVL